MRMYGERDERIATHLCKRLLMYARADRRVCVLSLWPDPSLSVTPSFKPRRSDGHQPAGQERGYRATRGMSGNAVDLDLYP